MFQTFDKIRERHNDTINSIDSKEVASMAGAIISAIQNDSTILVCGNGGSAADAQHFVAELTIRFESVRKAIPAVSLTADTSVITASGNDFGYESVFERQVEALGRLGDILLCLSTSGMSKNVSRAIISARKQCMKIWSITGNGGSDIAIQSDTTITLKGNTARIQEGTILILHYLALVAEEVVADA